MANTSFALNTERILNQIGSGLWGSEPALMDSVVSSSNHQVEWLQGRAQDDYRIEAGSGQGLSDITSSGWLGNVNTYLITNAPSSPYWVRLYSRLGNDPEQYTDRLFTPNRSGIWNDSAKWDDSLTWEQLGQ